MKIFNYPLQNAKPAMLLLWLIVLLITSIIFTALFSYLICIPIFGMQTVLEVSNISANSSAEVIICAKIIQLLSQLGMFIVPVLLLAKLKTAKAFNYIGFNKLNLNWKLISLSLIILIASSPFVNLLMEFNNKLVLPDFMKSIGLWMKESEEKAAVLTELFLKADNIGVFLFNLLLIAVIPAFAEEMLFRGFLQKIFHEMFKNIHIAILVSAFIFSAIHLQFYGFLPRFVLGIILGYTFYFTGNIWFPIIAHFVNNGMAVFISFLIQNQQLSNSAEEIGNTNNLPILALFSIIFTFFILYLMKIKSQKTI